MTAIPLKAGDEAYLTPRTLGCARECWQQPRVLIVAVTPPLMCVQLPDGREIRTHEDNVRRSRPEPPRDRRPRVQPRPVAVNCEEVPLW